MRRRDPELPAVRPRRRDPQDGRVRACSPAFIAVVYVAIVGGIGALVGSRSAHARRSSRRRVARGRLPAGSRPRAAVRRPARLRQARDAVRGALRVLRARRRGLRDRRRPAAHGADRSARARARRRRPSGSGSASELRPAATWPRSAAPRRDAARGDALPDLGEPAVEVRHRGELLGALSGRDATQRPDDPAKERLVDDLAAQAGLVLRNVRLIEELRASRQRLVAAQDEERRKLERNLHDGAQQQLVALAVKLRLARAARRARPGRRQARCSTRSRPARPTRSRTSATSRAASTRRCSPTRVSPRRSRRRRARRRSRRRRGRRDRALPTRGRGGRLLLRARGAENVAKYAEATRRRVRLAQTTGASRSRSRTTDAGSTRRPRLRHRPPGHGRPARRDRWHARGPSTARAGTSVTGTIPVRQGEDPVSTAVRRAYIDRDEVPPLDADSAVEVRDQGSSWALAVALVARRQEIDVLRE